MGLQTPISGRWTASRAPEPPVEALILYAVFLFSVTVHEAAHAWVALLGGDPTAYEGGQVTLDPIPHIQREPWGMVIIPVIALFLIGWPFGYASAPYDPAWAARYPKRAGWMALAGPAANLLLTASAVVAIWTGSWAGVFSAHNAVSFDQVASNEFWDGLAT